MLLLLLLLLQQHFFLQWGHNILYEDELLLKFFMPPDCKIFVVIKNNKEKTIANLTSTIVSTKNIHIFLCDNDMMPDCLNIYLYFRKYSSVGSLIRRRCVFCVKRMRTTTLAYQTITFSTIFWHINIQCSHLAWGERNKIK